MGKVKGITMEKGNAEVLISEELLSTEQSAHQDELN